MINIKQMGTTHLSIPIENPITFRCGACGCVFEANGSDVQYNGDLDQYTAKCPCCYKILHELNRE